MNFPNTAQLSSISQEYCNANCVFGKSNDPFIFFRRFTFARIDVSYARFFFYESAEKVLSYARLNCAVFDHKLDEKLLNTLTLPSQHSLPTDRKLEPEWLP